MDADLPFTGDFPGTSHCLQVLDTQVPFGLWIGDAAGHVHILSPTYLELAGIRLANHLIPAWSARLDDGEAAKAASDWKRCVAEGTPWEREFRLRSQDGAMHHVLSRGNPSRGSAGRIRGWVGLNLDLTGIREGDGEIRRFRERVLLALSDGGEFMYEAESSVGTRRWYGPMEELLGESAGTSPSGERDWRERVHPADREALDKALAGPCQEYRVEYRIRRADGGMVRILDRGRKVPGHPGHPAYLIGMVTNRSGQAEDPPPKPADRPALPADRKYIVVDRKPAAEGKYGKYGEDGADVEDGEERIRGEELLRTVQRMEMVRRLAGGSANDFNNLLTAINSVLGKQLGHAPRRRIGEILLDQGCITQAQLDQGVSRQKVMNLPLGRCLVKLGFIGEEMLLDVLAAQLNIKRVRLADFKFLKRLTYLISEEMARSYQAIPLSEKDGVITVAMADPTNLRYLDHIKFKTGREVEPVIASESEIRAALDRAYSGAKEMLASIAVAVAERDSIPAGAGLAGEVEAEKSGETGREGKEESAEEEGRQIIKIVNLIVSEAIRRGASDIHLEPQEKGMRIRYRIDGELVEQNPMPAHVMTQIIARFKSLGGMDIDENRRPMEGRAHIQYRGKEVDLRLSTFPVLLRARGAVEKMAIRIMDPNAEVAGLDKMRFSRSIFPALSRLIGLPDGIVLVTGPDGSGISSTLYAFIKHVSAPGVNVVTMEDPIEKDIAGISQCQVNCQAGFTFAAGIRALLRQDPDIIMLGEMRDRETAEMAIQASLTGHRVFSALHTDDAAGAFTRLLAMGLDPFLVTASVKGVLTQRLVRRICETCRRQVEIPDLVLQNIGIRPGTPFFQGKGCSDCNKSGYRGRIAIFELLVPDESVHRMILERRSSEEIKSYAIRNQGMATLRRDGLEKALQGLTTIEQVVSATQAEM